MARREGGGGVGGVSAKEVRDGANQWRRDNELFPRQRGELEERDKSRPHAVPLTAWGAAGAELWRVRTHPSTLGSCRLHKKVKTGLGKKTDMMKLQKSGVAF